MAGESPEIVPGSPEYDAAMAAKFDAHQAGTPSGALGDESNVLEKPPAVAAVAATRPDNVPEQYWDAEKGAVNTDALLAALAAKKEAPTGKPAPEAEAKADEVTTGEATEALEAKGLSMADLASEYADKGSLTDESYAKLDQAGIDRATVDAYIAGQQAVAELQVAKGHAAAGGAEKFAAMAEWAGSNLPAADVKTLNASLAGDEASMLMAVASLKSRYEAANGTQPKLLGGGNTQQGTTGYASRAEMVAEMNKVDARGRRLYEIDAGYRAKVQAKIGASSTI